MLYIKGRMFDKINCCVGKGHIKVIIGVCPDINAEGHFELSNGFKRSKLDTSFR
jgi:hypothetical protein